jgi:rSAM/selenodomain-associated transferase 2
VNNEDYRSISVIVPILNERKSLTPLTRHLASINAEQIILVDGGSTDGSVQWLQAHWQNESQGRIVIESGIGRARQMNTGARHANSDILVFLHADTRLPKNAKTEISLARNENYFWGRFDVCFEPASRINRAMKVIALFMNIRSRLSSIATGDQAMFVDRALFLKLGGFPLIPLMEDIALSKTLKRQGVPYCSSLQVRTSARRWQHGGVIRTVITMWAFRLAYYLGVDPQRLARHYRNIRE